MGQARRLVRNQSRARESRECAFFFFLPGGLSSVSCCEESRDIRLSAPTQKAQLELGAGWIRPTVVNQPPISFQKLRPPKKWNKRPKSSTLDRNMRFYSIFYSVWMREEDWRRWHSHTYLHHIARAANYITEARALLRVLYDINHAKLFFSFFPPYKKNIKCVKSSGEQSRSCSFWRLLSPIIFVSIAQPKSLLYNNI
jgi:hypothetical protein